MFNKRRVGVSVAAYRRGCLIGIGDIADSD